MLVMQPSRWSIGLLVAILILGAGFTRIARATTTIELTGQIDDILLLNYPDPVPGIFPLSIGDPFRFTMKIDPYTPDIDATILPPGLPDPTIGLYVMDSLNFTVGGYSYATSKGVALAVFNDFVDSDSVPTDAFFMHADIDGSFGYGPLAPPAASLNGYVYYLGDINDEGRIDVTLDPSTFSSDSLPPVLALMQSNPALFTDSLSTNFVFDGPAPGIADGVFVHGNLTNISVTPCIPAPGALALVWTGMIGLAGVRRR